MRLSLAKFVAPCLLLACTAPHFPADPIGALRAQAVIDMSCPAKWLEITPLGDETFKDTRQPLYQSVEGCRVRLTYVATDGGYVMQKSNRPPSKAPEYVDVR